jgi:hypothetical protein
MLGDRAVSMPSATADGVSIAIRSAERAVRAWLAGAGAGAYHRSLRGMLWPRASLAAELRAGGPEPGIAAGWIESRI